MTPDFEKYSIGQLLEAKKHIDKTAYPDRYEAILEQIEKRKQEAPEKNNGPTNHEQKEKRETQFGLVVIRLSMFGLIVCKLVSLLFFYYAASKFFDGILLGEVISRGNLRTLADDPASYFANMFFYAALAFFTFWYLTFGSKLQK